MAFVIPLQTTAYTSESIDLTHSFSFPHVFVGAGTFTGDESIAVEIRHCNGLFSPLYNENRLAVALRRKSPPLIITAPIIIRFIKPATTAACGIERICCTP
jgi:hypothetical protein